jgi:hypothetical protein
MSSAPTAEIDKARQRVFASTGEKSSNPSAIDVLLVGIQGDVAGVLRGDPAHQALIVIRLDAERSIRSLDTVRKILPHASR